MKKYTFLSIVCILVMFCSSCEKTGPQGPLGPTGANGVTNISSTVFTVPTTFWTYVAGDYLYTDGDTAISNPTVDGIQMFYSINSVDWFCLPQTGIWAGSDVMEFAYTKSQFTLYYKYDLAPAANILIKVVVIPPAIMKQHPNTNWYDYNQVSALIQAQKAFKN